MLMRVVSGFWRECLGDGGMFLCPMQSLNDGQNLPICITVSLSSASHALFLSRLSLSSSGKCDSRLSSFVCCQMAMDIIF